MEHINERDTVVIFGGTGFLGQYVVRELAKTGAKIRLVSRDGETQKNKYLRICGAAGQIGFWRADVTRRSEVEKAMADATHVINLVGLLYEKKNYSFTKVHKESAGFIAQCAMQHAVKRLVHVSALGCDQNLESQYARTKAAGEVEVQRAFHDAIIIRPSVIFGHEDKCINMFASMSKFMPFLPLIGGGGTKIQPVYVGDVAKAIVRALSLERSQVYGCTFELAGPKQYTMRDLMRYILKTKGRRRLLLSIPFWLAKLEAAFLERLPNPMLTQDQVELLKHDNVLAPNHKNGLVLLGIKPMAMEAVMTPHLSRQR